MGEVQWQGIAPATLDVPSSASLIHDGPNAVEVKALLDIGVPHSIFYVDSLDLDYDRVYQASGNTLAFRGDGHAVVTVGGFTEATIGVLDITDTLRPRRVVGTSLDGGAGNYRVSLVPFGPGENYVAATPSSWRAPKWTRPYRSARLTSSGQGADYVVLTTADLFTPARKLAALRQRDGLRTTVVDVADVMDEFNHGISDPRAIQTFLKWAAGRWSPAPRFVLLAGQGTYDYKDYLGHGGNLVPPLMVSTPSGLFASDNHLVDLDGDGLPDLAVGRIPVLSAGEFEGYVQKIQAYEASDGTSWDDRALWVADRASAGADFPAEAEGLVAALPPGYTPERVYLDDGTIVATRAQLMAGLSAGASLMNYVGHGGFDRLASDGLLLSSDVAALTNGGRLPFLTALTCVINRFEVPGFSPLGSELVKSPSGGVSAIWAPTGVSNDSEARALGRRFYAGMNANPTTPIGELVREAVRSFTPSASDRTLGSVYNLLGDPAVVLKSPEGPPAPPPGPSPSSSSRRKSTSGRAVGPT